MPGVCVLVCTHRSVCAILPIFLALMEPVRAGPEGWTNDNVPNKRTEATPIKSALNTKTRTGKRSKLSVDMGRREMTMRSRTPSVASNASRRGSITVLAQQLRKLEEQKEGVPSARCVVACSCTIDRYCP